MDAEAVRQPRMGLGWVFIIRGDSGSYCIIGWIVSYCQLDCIVSAGSYQETLYFMRWLVTVWMGWVEWMGRWWDGRTLAPAGTGAPPWAPEQERHR